MKVITAIAIFAAMIITTPTSANATIDPVNAGVYVIGDSITHGVHRDVLSVENRPVGWRVDAVPGRLVVSLGDAYIRATSDPYLSRRYIFNTNGATARTAVLALGTNGTQTRLSFEESKALYIEGVKRVRYHTGASKVVLVTAWRDKNIWKSGGINPVTGQPVAPYQYAVHSYDNSKAMRAVASEMPGVCIMNWRGYISQRPWLLRDGVHPNYEGRKAWRQLMLAAVRNCY